ncbi:PREDICTED: probable disease resistance protein At4g27220 [Theobroma cacao]|uniref:Probable disease resistance protein At4g27220 n=1 Tax=Theobroma cacao TaxID=3641 RepID=A0AB32WRU3_THECC|nr:PREDICTED: probable disease resistance protein At4g27220 [Theobroma cacao]XP_017980457.1 PREDICTED: probable disease resistance protein At4g27220 [Theobroma cacao]
MELIGPIFEAIKCFGGPICTYIDHHPKLEEHMNDLRRKVNDLNDQKEDLVLKKEAELRHGKVVKKEVENWFKDVEKVNTEMEKIETKFRVVSYFLRGHFGKFVCRKIEEVKEIHQQGSFPNGVAVDGPPTAGVTLPTPNIKGEIDVIEQIWKYLMGDKVGMIGICGMGGIGKTTIMKHINNQLLKESEKFDKVIWVTVSKNLNIFKLQEDIADSLKQSLPKNKLQQATTIKDVLERKRYVLILDDVWKRFSLLDVGIPEPILGMERKVVLTSRSIEVCQSMDCKVVKVQPLSKTESMNLFLDHVGHSVVQDQNLKDIVNKIVEHCGGLPLSIVTIAESMKGVNDICEWRNALTELEEHVKSVKGSDVEIFERLRFSYDHLKDPKIQNCFLYCSLYPEDFVIEKVELIENWIDEGLLDGLRTRKEMHDRGHSILNKLENNCLLERDETYLDERGVKMHDVLRDLALYIKGHQFMVKANVQLEELPSEQEWTTSVEKVSLMRNSKLIEIPAHISPECPHLSTLILQYCDLKRISESFFEHMLGLKVLNLSGNYEIENLPNSISKLKNLNALILANCHMLKYVPSLAELRALRKLDLFSTSIEEFPHGIEMLQNLRYFRLGSTHLKELPMGILVKISHLQCLLVELHLRGEEVGKLRKLECVSCSFCDMQEFKKYAESTQGKWPTSFDFQVGPDVNIYIGYSPDFNEIEKNVEFTNLEIERCDDVVLPNDLHTLRIEGCNDFKCLSHIPLFRKATDLKKCRIRRCEGIECVVDLSSWSCNALHNVEELWLESLWNLREVVRVGVAAEIESTSHAPTPPAFFSSLKTLKLYSCYEIKKLYPVELLQSLQNLEEIIVGNCYEMEEIIASEENQEREGTTFILPKLKSLVLEELPKLKSICRGGLVIPVDSLQHVTLFDCPEVKRIPLSLPLVENGKPLPPPFLKRIIVSPREWWESVEWDQPDAKDVLSPFVQYW